MHCIGNEMAAYFSEKSIDQISVEDYEEVLQHCRWSTNTKFQHLSNYFSNPECRY